MTSYSFKWENQELGFDVKMWQHTYVTKWKYGCAVTRIVYLPGLDLVLKLSMMYWPKNQKENISRVHDCDCNAVLLLSYKEAEETCENLRDK